VDVFVQGDQLLVKVNKITSIKTQLPYEYYSLEFCKPDTIINSAENLGEVLRGDRIENSVYMVSFSFFFIIWLPYMLARLSEHHRCLRKYT
jgi:transmembrane 9 superfamily protein 2/4